MKKFIQEKDQWLLERYPTLWNTKIVWVLAISMVLHLLFYISGYLSFISPVRLQQYKSIDFFLKSGGVFFGIIISILLLLLWLIALFRNNAFKNFYPFSRVKLFKHFVSYFVIFIATTTFYYSFTLGAQTCVQLTYDDARMKEDIKDINAAIPLLPFELSVYELERLRLPTPFDTLFCETNSSKIDGTKMVHRFKGHAYQYWNYRIVEIPLNSSQERAALGDRSIFTDVDVEKNVRIYYVKDEAQNPTLPFKTAQPSLYNYSEVFYSPSQPERYSYNNSLYTKEAYPRNKFNTLTIERRRSIEINQGLLKSGEDSSKNALKRLDQIADSYKIANNLDVEEWMSRQSYKAPFLIKELIENGASPFKKNRFQRDNKSLFELHELDLRKSIYFDASSLHRSLSNIEDMKTSNIFEGSIHMFIWLAFVFALLVFSFRTLGLKPLLFSLVALGVLAIVTSLLIAILSYFYRFNIYNFDLGYIVLITLGTSILCVTLFRYLKIRKLISGILMNITMFGFAPYVIIIFTFINEIQESRCPKPVSEDPENCFTILSYLGAYSSYLFLFIGFLFMFWYCKRLLNWRAMPEG